MTGEEISREKAIERAMNIMVVHLPVSWMLKPTLDCSRHKHLHTQNRRGSKRAEAPEVLLINGEPITEAAEAPGLFGDSA